RTERSERMEEPPRREYREHRQREPEPEPVMIQVPEPLGSKIKENIPSLNGTLEAVLLDEPLTEKGRFPISELVQKVDADSGVKFIIFDGIITQRLVDAAAKANISGIIGHRVGDIRNLPETLSVATFRDLGLE
ncbi:MAG: hypothetical protein OK454_08030, partial [Thaumarchaeota archaeon]|nr:hypothetical protein [Nitrososphaerota archaeon]